MKPDQKPTDAYPVTFKIHISRDLIFDEKKTFKFSEEGKLGKFSLCSSNFLKITGLEEGERDSCEEQGEQSVIDESRGRDLSQSKDSEEEEEPLRYRSIQSIYDETKLLCSETCLLFNEELSSYSLATKKKGVERSNEGRNFSNFKESDVDYG